MRGGDAQSGLLGRPAGVDLKAEAEQPYFRTPGSNEQGGADLGGGSQRRRRKVYLASKFENKVAVKAAQRVLCTDGYEVVGDWTDQSWDDPDLDVYALQAVMAVKECDAVVALMERKDWVYKGAWVELGIAIARWKPVFLIGDWKECIFTYLPNVYTFKDWPTFYHAFTVFEWEDN